MNCRFATWIEAKASWIGAKCPVIPRFCQTKSPLWLIWKRLLQLFSKRKLFSNNPKRNFKLKIANHDAFAHLFMRVYEQIMRRKSQFTAVKKSTFLPSPFSLPVGRFHLIVPTNILVFHAVFVAKFGERIISHLSVVKLFQTFDNILFTQRNA